MSRHFQHIVITFLLLAVVVGSVSGQEVTKQAVFCRTDGKIEADSSAMMTAEWRNRVVCDFLRYAVPSADVTTIDYCDTYSGLMMEDSTSISIDRVTFSNSGDKQIKWFADIPEKGYADIDIPSEAPEKCIAFRKDSTLIIVWCNLFADSDKIFNRVNEVLDMNKRYSVFQYDNGDDYIQDGMHRIIDNRWLIGYADENGKAKVTGKGEMKEVPGSVGEYRH